MQIVHWSFCWEKLLLFYFLLLNWTISHFPCCILFVWSLPTHSLTHSTCISLLPLVRNMLLCSHYLPNAVLTRNQVNRENKYKAGYIHEYSPCYQVHLFGLKCAWQLWASIINYLHLYSGFNMKTFQACECSWYRFIIFMCAEITMKKWSVCSPGKSYHAW